MKKTKKIIKKQKPTLPNKFFLLAVGFLATLIIFGYRGHILEFFQNKLTEPSTTGVIYHGILPCADCSGLQTILILNPSGANSDGGTYTLKQTYQGKNVNPLMETGVWTIEQKTFSGKSLNVYRLVADKTNIVSYYMQLDNMHLQMLDSQGNTIDTPFNDTLTKQQ